MEFPEFLENLKEIATSPLAFVGYVCVIVLWGYYYWINQKKNLIEGFQDDKLKLAALRELIKDAPPSGINLETWYELKLRAKKTTYFFISFIATLVVVLLIFTVSVFASITNQQTKSAADVAQQRDSLSKKNSDNRGSFNQNDSSFNGQRNDSSVEQNSNNDSSFNNNKGSFNN